jgi:hypothetical protein
MIMTFSPAAGGKTTGFITLAGATPEAPAKVWFAAPFMLSFRHR